MTAALATAVAPINILLNEIGTRLNDIDTRLNGMEVAMMRGTNGSVSLPSHEIVSRGQEPHPANFPATLAELLVLSYKHCNTLLTHFGVAYRSNASVAAKRLLLANYFGIRRSCMMP
jgi:hypothetical protein